MKGRNHDLRLAARRCDRGFSLLEVGLGVVIFGLVVGIVLTAAQRLTQRTRCDRLATDLRTFAAAFQAYHQRQSAWPSATSGDNAVPRGMENLLRDTPWAAGPPVGGGYVWVSPVAGTTPGAIGLTAFTGSLPLELSRADLLYLDRQMDDGNLATGRFRTGFNGWPLYFLPEQR